VFPLLPNLKKYQVSGVTRNGVKVQYRCGFLLFEEIKKYQEISRNQVFRIARMRRGRLHDRSSREAAMSATAPWVSVAIACHFAQQIQKICHSRRAHTKCARGKGNRTHP
jgi:hypothetical protein